MWLLRKLFGLSLDELAEKELRLKHKNANAQKEESTINVDAETKKLNKLKPFERIAKINFENKIGEYKIKYKYDNVSIYTPDINAVTQDMLYKKVDLVHEKDNEYDDKAILITCDNVKIGYIQKGRIQDMIHDWIKRNEPIQAAIYDINLDTKEVAIYICFYKNPLERVKNAESVTAKLTRCSNNECQENLLFAADDDEVDLEYDYDKEVYDVTNDMGERLGSISKSITRKIKEKEDDYEVLAFIKSIDTNDDTDKYVADIIVYFT